MPTVNREKIISITKAEFVAMIQSYLDLNDIEGVAANYVSMTLPVTGAALTNAQNTDVIFSVTLPIIDILD